MQANDHELVKAFQNQVYPLSEKLKEMLNEHYSHQTERRGCGYTQSTRLLAEYINQPRLENEFIDLKLFHEYSWKNIKKILDRKSLYPVEISSWRNLDINPSINHFLTNHKSDDDFVRSLKEEIDFQTALRTIIDKVQLEESQILCQMIIDVVLPQTAEQNHMVELKTLAEKPKVGSCPMAENFFLKIAHGSVLRQGEINIIVDEKEQPLLIEKMNMGDNHSCISLQTLLMNGVRVPAGSLFSLDYDISQIANKRPNKQFKGYVIPYTALNGFWFLRLTTLAISPENRKRAFSTHYKQQVANGLYSPGTTELTQLLNVAQAQI